MFRCFSTISDRAFQLPGYAFIFKRAQIGTRSPPPDPRLRIRYMIKNPFIYKPVFEAYKTRKTAPQAYKKPQDSIPKFVKKRFLRKVDVCNTFHAKTTIWKSQTSAFQFRNRYIKRWPDNRPEQTKRICCRFGRQNLT